MPTSIKAEQIGTYELEVTASKEGYKTITKKEQFGVIEGGVEITSSFGESEQESGNNGESDIRWGLMLMVLFGFLIMLLITLFLIYKISNSCKKKNQAI